MYSCLSGGGGTYGFNHDTVKPTSISSRISNSSSPSSTLSESTNSPISILNRKPRTPRKRPNQNYNEAAALLSTAYPKLFSTKHLTKSFKSSKLCNTFLDEPPELLLPFQTIDNSGFLLHQPILEKPIISDEPKIVNSREWACHSYPESILYGNSLDFFDGYQYDFDAESMLDEEIEEGIDRIMGNLSVNSDIIEESTNNNTCIGRTNTGYGYPLGLEFSGSSDFGFTMRRGIRALRNVDDSNWWNSHTVDIVDITPKFNMVPAQKKKKKVVELKCLYSQNSKENTQNLVSLPVLNARPRLKLNYNKVIEAWLGRGSPFVDEISESESLGNDANVCSSTPDRKSKSKKLYKEQLREHVTNLAATLKSRMLIAATKPMRLVKLTWVFGCLISILVGTDVEASARLPFLVNPQTLEPTQYITITGCCSNCNIACCYCNIKKQSPVCLKCCQESP